VLIRPQDRPLRLVTKDEEPTVYIDKEVEDIDLMYPTGLVQITLHPDEGDKYEWIEQYLKVTSGRSITSYNTKDTYYVTFRKRTVKVPEPKYIPPSALGKDPVDVSVVEHTNSTPDNLS